LADNQSKDCVFFINLEAKLKGFGIFHDSDARHFLAAVCLVSLFLGGLSACGTPPVKVSQPEGKQITSSHEWLLVMVQRTLPERLTKYSAKKVTVLPFIPPPPQTINSPSLARLPKQGLTNSYWNLK
jgi:hypothetical protein